jgi:hypothetical protein
MPRARKGPVGSNPTPSAQGFVLTGKVPTVVAGERKDEVQVPMGVWEHERPSRT